MRGLVSAIRFSTILPIGKSGEFDPKFTVPCFPLVGLILGGMLAVFDMAVTRIWPVPVASVLDVVFLVAVTGAFHLDGLGDSADGMFGHRPRERVLEIMKDSRIGIMALAAVVCSLAVKWGGISCLNDHRALFLLIIPAYARGSMLFGFRFLEYGRPQGVGKALFERPADIFDFKWLLVPVALSLLAGWRAVWVNICFIAIVALILYYYKKRMGCVTGDMLGAMTEITESFMFLLVSAAEGPC